MLNPKLPGNEADPTGQGASRRRAAKKVESLFQQAGRDIRSVVNRLPRKSVAGEDSKALKSETRKADLKANELVTNKHYQWLVDDALMNQTMNYIRRILTNALLSGDTMWSQRFWMNAYLDPAYEQGTTQSFFSAQAITRGLDLDSTNQLAIQTAEQQLMRPEYLTRVQLMHGRVFEDMLGIVGDSVAQLRRVLTDGMARGLGIRDVSGMINDRLGVGMARAQRIARTEINKAYTDAYMDESAELNKNLAEDDLQIRQMHVSSLTSTTRQSHAARHGKLYTKIEQQKWWDSGSNRINCYCTVIDILVNLKTGESYQQALIDRTRKRGEEYFKYNGVKV